ncbi:MAG TPA: carboxypeptidase-like regulatory domain-containing protein [Verrucomicrobiae bacterium]|jgi:hypothetical protein|nr:carboxypeptidase-like regulatory domain-containing protein [Verrucomicrobiae bacterium]
MTLLKTAAALVVLGFALTAMAGNKSDEQKSTLNFVVVRDSNGKPVRYAEIVLHPVGKDGKQKQDGLELKTHEDGTATISGVKYGKLRIQVIAPGFRTYGEDFDIRQPQRDITIKLQKPADQLTIYK